MKRKLTLLIGLIMAMTATATAGVLLSPVAPDTSQWIVFHNNFRLDERPVSNTLRIAADSKYWLWVNGRLEVAEGALKRGPNRTDTYADVVKLKHLRKGDNRVDVLVWYWGKQGFSHRSTATAGLYFDLAVNGRAVSQTGPWRTALHPAFFLPNGEIPNYRLSESNIGFDARKDIDFTSDDFDFARWAVASEISLEQADWNRLVDRPIPQWKDYGMKKYESVSSNGGEYVCRLPYNAQVTPYLKVKANAGDTIHIRTDHYAGGGELNVRAVYVTREGVQEYENPGWMNGQKVIYSVPASVEVLELKYRETGYDCELSGEFKCDDERLNTLWKKSQRTLYVTMRDNYMDCPDRERAQWIGDVTNELVETFYALSPSATALTRKCLLELAAWQRADSVMYSPVPEGNWKKELPMQTLAMVGLGTWNYYLGSGDKETLRAVNSAYKRYMHKWRITADGLVEYRKGAWDWGDWGENQDMQAMCQMWYAITLEYYAKQCDLLGQTGEAEWAREVNRGLKAAIHRTLWNGYAYKHPQFTGKPDDRVQALAVLAGVAREEEYPLLLNVLATTEFASPYMERYVLEAMCEMGYTEDALRRMTARYEPMINGESSTLWEVFDMSGNPSRWSLNHAWSGGPLIMLSRYIAGITPRVPGFKEIEIAPRPCGLREIKAVLPTEQGELKMELKGDCCRMELRLTTPVPAHITAPAGYEISKGAAHVRAGRHKVIFEKKNS